MFWRMHEIPPSVTVTGLSVSLPSSVLVHDGLAVFICDCIVFLLLRSSDSRDNVVGCRSSSNYGKKTGIGVL